MNRIVLIAHSLSQHKEREPIPYIQELLSDFGYSSLAINYSLGIDDRHGPFDCFAPHRHTLDGSISEIGAWVTWLKGRGFEKLVVMGHSYGGNDIARFAANNDDNLIHGVVLLGPGTADHRAWSPTGYETRYGKKLGSILEQAEIMIAAGMGNTILEDIDFLFCPRSNVSAESFVAYYRADTTRLLHNLIAQTKKPTLFIAASEDNRMQDLTRLVMPYTGGELTQIAVVDGAGHFFLDLFSDDAVDYMVSFFNEIAF